MGRRDQQSMARRFWAEEDPIGRRLRFNGPTWRTVVGMVGDVLHDGLDGTSKPELYMPVAQSLNIESGPTIVVRTTVDSAPGGRGVAWGGVCYRSHPAGRPDRTDGATVSGSVAQPRFRTMILAAFSLLALVMASIVEFTGS